MAKTQPAQFPVQDQIKRLYRQALAQGVSLESLDKMVSKYAQRDQVSLALETVDDVSYTHQINNKTPLPIRAFATILPMLFLGLGLFLIANAVVPIAQYYLTEKQDLYVNDLAAPIPPEDVIENLSSTLLAASLEQTPQVLAASSLEQDSKPIILDEELDYTNLANWFSEPLELGE